MKKDTLLPSSDITQHHENLGHTQNPSDPEDPAVPDQKGGNRDETGTFAEVQAFPPTGEQAAPFLPWTLSVS
jgi:hypothetical protein